MSKHTPGPWYLDEVSADDWQVNSDLHDHCLFQITPTIGVESLTDEDKANAQLITAAPELLEALRALMENYEIVDGLGFNMFAVTKALRAIKKATGCNK